jgi:hypothetical protein
MPFDETTITCAWVRERVDDYSDGAEGDLSREAREAIARHAALCDACRAEIELAAAVVQELRAFPLFAVPDRVIAAAAAAIGAEDSTQRFRPERARAGLLAWVPATVAAAALVVLVATARWSGPVATVSGGFAEARVERAARETVLALSYINHYARMTGEIVTGDVLEKRLVGTMERAVDRQVIGEGMAPPLRRAMKETGIVETRTPHERS